MLVKRLFASFGYEQFMICAEERGRMGSLPVPDIPRNFVRALEDELVLLSGKGSDNKTGYVFEGSDGKVYAVSFWDDSARFVSWYGQYWDRTPVNLWVKTRYGEGGKNPTPADLGLPPKEEFFNK